MIGKSSLYEPYSQTLSRQYPGLFVILLDQSESMLQKDLSTGLTKADTATSYVNFIIERMIRIAQFEELSGRRKNYAYVSILGYNDAVYPLLRSPVPVALPDLDESALGRANLTRLVPDGQGQAFKRVVEKTRVWIRPHGEGKTDMTLAFEEAERVVRDWLRSPRVPYEQALDGQFYLQGPREESFPPILIHITDAKDGGQQDPHPVSERIRQMETKYGKVLLFNCHFTHERVETCVFPATLQEVRSHTIERQAAYMFDMSSEMPEILRERARAYMQRPIPQGARCFIYNANPEVLLNFLRWTTLGTSEMGGR
ncbi:MAG TPA: hypothetical protein VGD98_10215 [Ktedonobacteraceae bacterium]